MEAHHRRLRRRRCLPSRRGALVVSVLLGTRAPWQDGGKFNGMVGASPASSEGSLLTSKRGFGEERSPRGVGGGGGSRRPEQQGVVSRKRVRWASFATVSPLTRGGGPSELLAGDGQWFSGGWPGRGARDGEDTGKGKQQQQQKAKQKQQQQQQQQQWRQRSQRKMLWIGRGRADRRNKDDVAEEEKSEGRRMGSWRRARQSQTQGKQREGLSTVQPTVWGSALLRRADNFVGDLGGAAFPLRRYRRFVLRRLSTVSTRLSKWQEDAMERAVELRQEFNATVTLQRDFEEERQSLQTSLKALQELDKLWRQQQRRLDANLETFREKYDPSLGSLLLLEDGTWGSESVETATAAADTAAVATAAAAAAAESGGLGRASRRERKRRQREERQRLRERERLVEAAAAAAAVAAAARGKEGGGSESPRTMLLPAMTRTLELDDLESALTRAVQHTEQELGELKERAGAQLGDLRGSIKAQKKELEATLESLRSGDRTLLLNAAKVTRADLRARKVLFDQRLRPLLEQQALFKAQARQSQSQFEDKLRKLRENTRTFLDLRDELIRRKSSSLCLAQENAQAIKRVLDLTADKEGWSEVSADEDMKVYRKLLEDGGSDGKFACVKATYEMRASVEAVQELFADNSRVAEYNKYFLEGRDLESLDAKTKVVWALSPAIFPFRQRDYCTVVHYRTLDDGTVIVLNRAAEHPEAPVSKKLVRAKIILGANIIEPLGPDRCKFTMLTQLDPGGVAPPWIVNKLSTMGPPLFLRNVERAARGEATEDAKH